MTEAIICDLDGTLSINDHGRSFFEAHDCDRDSLNEPVGRLLEWARECDIEIIYLSGREDKYQEPTLRFLSNHNLSDNNVLIMRETGDNRADDIIKWEIWYARSYKQ